MSVLGVVRQSDQPHLKMFLVLVTLFCMWNVCLAGTCGSESGLLIPILCGDEESGSGESIVMCPDPDCLSITPLMTSIEVDFGLRCIPEESLQCRYNYTVDYFDPEEDNLLASETRGLTLMEINSTVFSIYPSSLRDGLVEFENGVIVVIIVYLIDGGDITQNTTIPGEFAPSILNLIVTNVDNISIQISWSLPFPEAPPDNYIITYNYTEVEGIEPRQGSNSIEVSHDSLLTTGSVFIYDITQLLPYTDYDIGVVAVYTGVESESIITNSRTEEGVSSPVTNISVVANRTSMNLIITWMEPMFAAGIIINYTISVTQEDDNNIITLQVPTSSLRVTSKFEFFVEYNISIVPINGFGAGESSVIVMTTSPEGAPSSPENFNVVQVTDSSTTLSASWTQPSTLNGVLTNYTVYCRISSEQFYSEQIPNSNEFTVFNTTSPDTTEVVLTGLKVFTVYECYVTASTNGGESEPSNSDSATTDEDTPTVPRDFNYTQITSTSVTLEWTRPEYPNGVISEYVLEYDDESLITISIPVQFINDSDEYNETNITVEYLNEFTNYIFNLLAVTGGGTGPEATIDITTNEDLPSAPPENLTGMFSSATSLLISWFPPPEQDQNGVIMGYNISYFDVDNSDIVIYTSTQETMIDITDLKIYTEYNVSVAAYTSIGTGPFDSIIERTDSSVPEAPQNLIYRNLSSTSIEVSWDAPTSFNGPDEGYEVVYIRSETSESNTILNISETSVNISGLEKYELYSVQVVALSDKGPGDEIEITVLTDEDVPGVVSNFTANEINLTAIVVEWRPPSEPNGIITLYEIEYTLILENSNETMSVNFTASELEEPFTIELTDLEVFSEYDIRVRAFTSRGPGIFTDIIQVRTDPAPASPPTNVQTTPDKRSILLEWGKPERPDGIIEGYYIITNATFPVNISIGVINIDTTVLNVSSDIRSIIFDNLVPYTVYEFSVAAYSFQLMDENNNFVIIIGEFSEVITIRTLEDAPSSPENFSVVQVTDSSTTLSASWTQPSTLNGILTNYTVYCRISSEQFYSEQIPNSNEFTVFNTTSPYTTEVVLTGLKVFTVYECYVTASTNGGESEPSNSDSATTDEDTPTVPRDFNYIQITSTSVTLEWTRPEYPNGVISEYVLEYVNKSLTQPINISIPVQFIDDSDEYNETNITVEYLNEFTNYTFNLSAVTGGGTGPEATIDITTDEDLPSAPPENLTGMFSSATSLLISWFPPPEQDQNGVIMGYNISYFEVDNSDIVTYTSTQETMIDITDLMIYTEYNVSVAAYTSIGTGPFDSIIERTDSSVPEAPQNLIYRNLSSTSIEVSWDAPTSFNGPDEGYEVVYIRSETSESNTILNISETSVNISGLEKYELYSVQVVALSDKGPGDEIEITVLTDEDVPGVVSNFTANEINLTAIVVEWRPPSEPNGIITMYEIEYTLILENSNETMSEQFTASELEEPFTIELTDLEVFSEYDIRVRAFTSRGPGIFTDIIQVRTDPAPASPPTNVQTTPDKRSILLEWGEPERPDGIIEGYYIITNATFPDNISPGVINTNTTVLNVSSDILSIIFDNLIPYTVYEFSVAAYSFQLMDENNDFVIIIGEFSEVITIRTLEDAPSSPENFSVVQVTDSSTTLSASWTQPSTLNGILTIYTVYCRISSEQFYSEQYEEQNFTVTTSPNTTEVVLTDLKAFTVYECYVTASTNGGESEPSNNDLARTDEDTPTVPRDFNYTQITSTSVTLEWTRPEYPNGVISEYVLEYDDESLITISIPVQFINDSDEYNETNITVEYLNEFTNYIFNLLAITGGGTGPEATIDITTNEDVPSAPPENLTGMFSSATSLLISWFPPPEQDQNGVIMGYNISYFEVDNSDIVTYTSTQETMIDITDLMIYTEYNVSVAAYTSIGTGPFDSIIERTDSSVPEAPQNLTYRNLSSTSIEVSWDAPTSFNGPDEGYEVVYIRSETNESNTILNISETSVNISGLEKYELYSVQVVALSDKGPGDEIEITVLTDEDVPGVVSNFTANEINLTAIVVEWRPPSEPNGIITMYEIEYTLILENSNETMSELFAASELEEPFTIELTDLEVFSEYDIRVRAFTSRGPGIFTDIIQVRTDPGPASPPTNVQTTPDKRSILLEWGEPERPDGMIEGYYIITNATFPVGISPGVINTNTTVLNVSSDIRSIIFDNLIPYTVYEFSVAAYSFQLMDENNNFAIIIGEFSDVITNRTLEDAPSSPLNFNVVQVLDSSTTLSASWTQPSALNGILTIYTVYCRISSEQFYSEQIPDEEQNFTVTTSPNTTEVVLTGLKAFTAYECYVTASTNGGESEPSNSDSATTDEDTPTIPRDFNYTEITSTSVTLEWRRPEYPNGVISEYVLEYDDESLTQPINISIPVQFINDSDEYNETSITVEYLNEFTNYTFNLSAVTGGGRGPEATIDITTDEDVPGVVSDFTADEINLTAIVVEWRPPSEPNGIITLYEIEYTLILENSNETMSELFTASELEEPFTIELTDLEVFSEYDIRVRAFTSRGPGIFTDIIRVRTDPAPASPPTNVQTTPDKRSILLEWGEPERPDGIIEGYYIITNATFPVGISPGVINIDTTVLNVSSDIRSIIFDNLIPYTVYEFSVAAYSFQLMDENNNFTIIIGEFSEVITIRTLEDAPSSPENFNVVQVSDSSTTLSASWTQPSTLNGVLTNYTVYCRISSEQFYSEQIPNSNEFTEFNTTSPDTTEVVLTGLKVFTVYECYVTASTNGGESEPSNSDSATTDEDTPTVPRDFNYTEITSTSVTLEWRRPEYPNGVISEYVLEYVNKSLTQPINISIPVQFIDDSDEYNETNITVEYLNEFTNYTFNLSAVTGGGRGPEATIDITTDEDVPSAPPENLTGMFSSATSLLISWFPPPEQDQNGVIMGYNISYFEVDNSDIVIYTSTQETMIDITGLMIYTEYNVSVAAYTSIGTGPFDSIIERTDSSVPSAPNVTLTVENSSTILVEWTEPEPPNGIIRGYYIFYFGTKTSGDIFEGLNTNLTILINGSTTRSYVLTGLLSDSTYSVNVTAFTSKGNGSTGIGEEQTLPTGIPPSVPTGSEFTISTPTQEPGEEDIATDTTIRIEFVIPEELNRNGPIQRVRIVVRVFGSTNDTIDNWYNSFNSRDSGSAPPYQAVQVDIEENRKRGLVKRQEDGGEMVAETIGSNTSCGRTDEVCNGPLRPDTEYQFKYRAYTSDDDNSFVESVYSGPIRTASRPQTTSNSASVVAGVVIGLILAIIIVGVVILVIVILIRRQKNRKYSFRGNGTSEILFNESNTPTLTRSSQVGTMGPTIVPLSENTIINKSALRTASVKATPHSRKIYLRDLPGYVSDMMSDTGFKFSEEYERVSAIGLDHSKDASLMPENRAKNRYTNILSYDHSRVKLDYVDDEPGSDYINANYIPGYRVRRAYIATQGPLPSTFDDFWTMVWEQNTHNIVMLTQLVERGRTKCHRYWPGSLPEVYGDVTVEMLSEKENNDWITRKFELRKEKRSRVIHHYQFISWPDHGVPETATAALDFVRSVHDNMQSIHGPVVVHCSAGVGRTGTFIALGTLLQHIKDHDWIDVFGLSSEMRQHRNHMIQTEAQYIFIHKAMVEVCEYLSTFNGKQMNAHIYANVGARGPSQQSDLFGGSLLSEEVSRNDKPYDESKF